MLSFLKQVYKLEGIFNYSNYNSNSDFYGAHFFCLLACELPAGWSRNILQRVVRVSPSQTQYSLHCDFSSSFSITPLLPNPCPIDEEPYIFHVTFCRLVCKWSMTQVSSYRSHKLAKQDKQRKNLYTKLVMGQEWCLTLRPICFYLAMLPITYKHQEILCLLAKRSTITQGKSGNCQRKETCSLFYMSKSPLSLPHTLSGGSTHQALQRLCLHTHEPAWKIKGKLHPQPGLPSLLSSTISLINLSENL